MYVYGIQNDAKMFFGAYELMNLYEYNMGIKLKFLQRQSQLLKFISNKFLSTHLGLDKP